MPTEHDVLAAPPPALVSGVTASVPPESISALESWFDELEDERVHPEAMAARLRRTGWTDAAAAWAEARYRSRWSSHPAVWWGGFTAIGVAVLACAGVAHSLIDGEREDAASWFAVALVAVVFAFIAGVLMDRITDWTQCFSASRRAAASTLFWAAIVVAVVRGLTYGQVLGNELLVGDSCETSYTYDIEGGTQRTVECQDRGSEALAHLALTTFAAGPVAAWAWYLHRRPTDPPPVRRESM